MRAKFTYLKSLMTAAAFVVAVLIAGSAQAQGTGRTIWEGFHLGGHVGNIDSDFGISQPAPPLVTLSDSDDDTIAGFVYGSSWQFGNLVIGTDSAYNFGDQQTGLNTTAMGAFATAEFDWSSETRLRAGFLVKPSLLIYGTVGVAFAELDVNGTIIAGGNNDERLFGISYGGGAELTTGGRWFARIEYIHMDFDEEKFANAGGSTFNVDLEADIIRGAIGYRFDWSPLDLFTGR